MRTLKRLFENNRQWAARMERQQPGFFGQLQRQQTPEFLWIGCSDSRVPANEIVGLMPGELFVHRNTVNNKIGKLKTLLPFDLDDGRMRQLLLFSCQTLHYYALILHFAVRKA